MAIDFEKINTETKKEKKESIQPENPLEVLSNAADNLAGMIEQKEIRDMSEEKIKEQCGIIFNNQQYLNSRDFFSEVLPVALKFAKLEDKLVPADALLLGPGGETQIETPSESLIRMIAMKGIADITDGIIRNLAGEEKSLENVNSGQAAMLLESLDRVFWKGNFSQSLGIKEFFDKYHSGFGEIINQKGTAKEKEINKKVQTLMGHWVVEHDLFRKLEDEFCENKVPGEKAMRFLTDKIEKYGIPGKEVIKSWVSNIESGPSLATNFYMMRNLEEKEPGAVKFLYEQFGIRNFRRYPEEVLIAQFREYGNKEKPYGIIVNPLNDWNGAFASHSKVWASLHQQLEKEGYGLRIVEAGSKIELAKHLVRLDQRYGDKHKINFAFIGGHGYKDSIKFGGEKDINSLYAKDLTGRGVRRTSRFFGENPTFVLVSCLTGVEHGIGEKLSEAMNAEVIAPNISTHIKEVKVSKKDNSLRFEVEFSEAGAIATFKKGALAGKKI